MDGLRERLRELVRWSSSVGVAPGILLSRWRLFIKAESPASIHMSKRPANKSAGVYRTGVLTQATNEPFIDGAYRCCSGNNRVSTTKAEDIEVGTVRAIAQREVATSSSVHGGPI